MHMQITLQSERNPTVSYKSSRAFILIPMLLQRYANNKNHEDITVLIPLLKSHKTLSGTQVPFTFLQFLLHSLQRAS